MFTWVPLYFLILFGLWSVRDFWSMLWVDSCHALFCFTNMSSCWCYAYIVMQWLVVSESSLLSSVHDVAVLLGWICYFVMLYKHVATNHYMHNLEMFYKHVLIYMSCSIHSCPWLQLWSSLACHFRALLLLQNVSWQIVYMLFNLAKLVVDPCMLWTCSWLGLFHKHVFLMMLCLSCHAMTCGECIELVK